jgi:hypothetical protein
MEPEFSPKVLELERLRTPAPPKVERKLRWQTAKEICDQLAENINQIAPYLVAGCLTEFDAFLKAGKTTYVMALAKAIIEGKPFLGIATQKSPVVYLNEASKAAFREAVLRADLAGCLDLHVVSWAESGALDWAAQVTEAAAVAVELGAKALIVDTFAQWARLVGDDENSAGRMLAAMEPLQRAAAKGLAVLVVRHARKSGGDVGMSGRGSSAISAACDIILSLERVEGQRDHRRLKYVGRFDFPTELELAYDEGSFELLGTPGEATKASKRALVADVLPAGYEEAASAKDLVRAIQDRGEKIALRTVNTTLDKMVAEGRANKAGRGTKIDPFVFKGSKLLE